MTYRERVLAILNHQKPDVLPWFGDLAYWIDYLNDDKKMPEKYLAHESETDKAAINMGLAAPFHAKGLLELHRDLNVGFYLQGYFPFTTQYDGVEVINEFKNNGTTRITTLKTPHGDLQEIWEYVHCTHSWGPKSHMVHGLEDLKKIRYVYEHTYYEPDYALAKERTQSVGDLGLNLVYMNKSPIMEMIALRAGIQCVTYMIADDVDEWEETLAVMEKKVDESCELALRSPGDCIMIPDNLSSESIGRQYYRSYAKPYHEKWCARIKQACKYSFVHLDGTINPLVTELSDAGFDVIEALTPKPVGDLEFSQIRPLTKKNAVLWGGIPGGFFVDDLSDQAFDTYVIGLIEQMVQDGRSVLAVGDQVVPNSSFARIQRVAELVEKYGKF